jgi:hypothetical protein
MGCHRSDTMQRDDNGTRKANTGREMKKALYRGLLTRTQVAEILNFYRQSRDLAAIEKAQSEKRLQEIDSQNDREGCHAARERISFYARYPWYLRVNAFLMLFSLVEELLVSAFEVRTEADIKSDGSGIQRFKRPYCEKGVDLTSIKRWEFLTKCQTVRNALLHANGNIALCSNADDIRVILRERKWSSFFSKRKGLVTITKRGQDRSEYIEVTEAGLNELLQAFYDLEELLLGPNDK